METPLNIWLRRRDENWLHGVGAARFRGQVEARRRELDDATARAPDGDGRGVRVLVVDPAADQFLAGVLAALAAARPVEVFLGSPRWRATELEGVLDAVQPDLVWGRGVTIRERAMVGRESEPGETIVWIPTGGSTGGMRFAAHTWETLTCAAAGLQAWLGGGAIDSVCFLPLYHVSGFMQFVRSFATDGVLTLSDWPMIERGSFPVMRNFESVTSLVPTQLARLLDMPDAVAWLKKFRCVFLGGAAAWPALLQRALVERVPLSPCYGMTETAAQIAAMRPENFHAGAGGVGDVLPHARVEIVDTDGTRIELPWEEGAIRVSSAALCLGIHPLHGSAPEYFNTSDRGCFDEARRLHVLGRADAMIITGGEKVDPLDVEAAIRATGLVSDVAVLGLPDSEWGEAVIAVVAGLACEAEALRDMLRTTMSPHKVPKRIVGVQALPRIETGKIDRRVLRALAEP